MTKEGLKDEFKRHEHTALMQVIKSVSITFDRNQLKSLLKLRVSMEQKIAESYEPKSAIENELQCLALLNTILMDIEDIDEVKPEWLGSEVMDKRIAQLRRETEKKAEEEALESYDYYEMTICPYKVRNPKNGSLHDVSSSVIEVMVKKDLNLEKYKIIEEATHAFGMLQESNEVKLDYIKDAVPPSFLRKKEKHEHIREFGPVVVIELQ